MGKRARRKIDRLSILTPTDARNAIYIDFEGNADMQPTLLGALYKDLETGNDIFNQYVHEETFYPAGTFKANCVNASIDETFAELIRIARAEDRKLFVWSIHEQETVESYVRDQNLKNSIL